MIRALRVKRLYSLGDYKNIEFYDEITDIPTHVAVNKDAVNLINFYQLLSVEKSFREYMELQKNFSGKNNEECLELIMKMQEQTYEELLKAIENGKIDNEEVHNAA